MELIYVIIYSVSELIGFFVEAELALFITLTFIAPIIIFAFSFMGGIGLSFLDNKYSEKNKEKLDFSLNRYIYKHISLVSLITILWIIVPLNIKSIIYITIIFHLILIILGIWCGAGWAKLKELDMRGAAKIARRRNTRKN